MPALPGHTSKQGTGNNKKPLDRKTPIQVRKLSVPLRDDALVALFMAGRGASTQGAGQRCRPFGVDDLSTPPLTALVPCFLGSAATAKQNYHNRAVLSASVPQEEYRACRLTAETEGECGQIRGSAASTYCSYISGSPIRGVAASRANRRCSGERRADPFDVVTEPRRRSLSDRKGRRRSDF